MTEDASPENLRKFLESDDPAMVRMGLSMAKGIGFTDDLLEEILWMYMMHDDKTIRATAKSTFIKIAPDDVKQIVKENWKASYRKRWIYRKKNPQHPYVHLTDNWTYCDRYIADLVNELLPFVSLIEPLIKVVDQDNLYLKEDYLIDRNISIYQLHSGLMDAFERIGEPAIDPIIKTLMGQKHTKRSMNFFTELLGNIGDERTIKPLIHILNSNHKRTQHHKAAKKALEKLSHMVK